jgi:nucleotide-binding universal stress UspA family protein
MVATTFVVPLDGSPFAERAVPIACTLAERVDGRLILVSAPYKGVLRPREYLAEVAARCSVPVESSVDAAYLPADALTSVVEESDDRIVCMTSHGRGGLRWSVVGSTAEEVIRRSDRPIVLVGRHCSENFLTHGTYMLAAVDGIESSGHIAPVAREWAERLGLRMKAAVVVHPLDVEIAEHPAVLLDPIIDQFGGPEHVTANLLRSSYDAGALADFAVDLPAAMIAMDCHGSTGIARVALGSVTMAVVHLAACPLLVTHSVD